MPRNEAIRRPVISIPKMESFDDVQAVLSRSLGDLQAQLASQLPVTNYQGKRIQNVGVPQSADDVVTLKYIQGTVQKTQRRFPDNGAGSSTGTDDTVPLAPNVSPGPVSVLYSSVGTIGYFYTFNTITLPVADPAYAHLQKIRVWLVTTSNTPNLRQLIGEISAPFTGSTVDFQSILVARPTVQKGYSVEFQAINEDGVVTPGPATVAITVVPGEPLGGVDVSQSIVSVTLAEVGSRTADENGLPYMYIQTTVEMFEYAGYPQIVTFWLSRDGGVTYNYQQFHSLLIDGSYNVAVTYNKVVPLQANESWKMAAALGAYPGNPAVYIAAASLPTIAHFSNTLTATVVPYCASTDVTSISFLNYPATGTNIKYGVNQNGVADWGWYALQMTLPTIATDYAFWYAPFTVQKGHVTSGTFTAASDYEGVERQFADSGVVTGGVAGQGQTITFYGPGATNAWTLPPALNADSTTNVDRTYRIRVYANSRKLSGTTSFINFQTAQAGWSGSATFFDLTPVAQPATLDLGLANPNTTGGGNGLQVDPNQTSRPILSSTIPLFSQLPNYHFEYSQDGSVVASDVNWGYGGTGSVNILSSGGSSGKRFARLQGQGVYLSDKFGVPCQYLVPVQAAVSLQSSNHGAPHTLSLYLEWRDKNGTFISTSTIGSATGYIPSWTQYAISGSAIPPATATRVFLYCITNVAETAGAYWDVDDVILQSVLNQPGNGQNNSGFPVSGTGGYTGLAISSLTTSAGSQYGLQQAIITDASGGYVNMNVGSSSAFAAQVGLYNSQLFATSSAATTQSLYNGGANAAGFSTTSTTASVFTTVGANTSSMAPTVFTCKNLGGVTQTITFPKTTGTIVVTGGIITSVT